MASKYFVPVALVVALFVSDALFAFVVAKGGGGGGGGGRGGGGSLGGGGSRGSGSGGGGSMPILSNHGNRSSSPSRFYDHRDRVPAFGCVVLVAFVLFFWDFIDYSMPCNHGGDSNIWEIFKAVKNIWAPQDEKGFFAASSEDKLFEN